MFEIDENLSLEELQKIGDESFNIYSKYYAYHKQAMLKGSEYSKCCLMDVADKRWAHTACNEYKFQLAKELDENNHGYGSNGLSYFYANGTGTDQNSEKVIYYAKRAHNLNKKYFSVHLALLYLDREFMEFNPKLALETVEETDDYDYIKTLCDLLNLDEDSRKLKAREYMNVNDNKYEYSYSLYNSLSKLSEDEDIYNYTCILNTLGGYTRINKAYELLKNKKEVDEDFEKIYQKVYKKYRSYRSCSIIGTTKQESVWKLSTIIEERSPHFWQLFNDANDERNIGYFASAQWKADWLVNIYPDSSLARLCCLFAYACIMFEENSRFFNLKHVFTSIKDIKNYDCINSFNDSEKTVIIRFLNEVEKRNSYNKKQLEELYGVRSYWTMPFPVFIVSGNDNKSKEKAKIIKNVLKEKNINCFYQNEKNLLTNAINSITENAVRINAADLLIFVIGDTTRMNYSIWNYGDYYTRDKSEEYEKRLIVVGPENKRESLGYRFKADYFLNIDDENFSSSLHDALNYVKKTRSDRQLYSLLNNEIIKINGNIDKYIAYSKEFCKKYNLEYKFPDPVFDNGSIYYVKTEFTNNDLVVDLLRYKFIHFIIGVRSFLNTLKKIYYELRLYDFQMNLVSSNSSICDVYNFLKPRSIVAEIDLGIYDKVYQRRICYDGLYFVEITCRKDSDPNSKFLGKICFPVCLRYLANVKDN